MKVTLDTNVLLISIPKQSKYRPIFDKLLTGEISLVISNEILFEYLEIIGRKTTWQIANNLGDLILKLPKTEKVDVRIRWQLINQDPDDNKFVDCAIAGNVKYIVTNDKHFNVLKEIKFPPVEIRNVDEFLDEITKK